MKKIILLFTSLLLALALCVLFVACDDDTTTPEAGGTTEPTVDTRTPWELLKDAVIKTATPSGNAAYDALMAALADGRTVEFSLAPQSDTPAAEGQALPFDRFTGKAIGDKNGSYAEFVFGLGEKTGRFSLHTTPTGFAFTSSAWDKVYGISLDDIAKLIAEAGETDDIPMWLFTVTEGTQISEETVQALLGAVAETVPAEKSEQNGLVVITVTLTAEKLKALVPKINDVAKAHADFAAILPPMSDEEVKETVENIEGPGAITLTVTLNENETIRSAALAAEGMEDANENFAVALTMTENGGFTVDVTDAENGKTSIAWTVTKNGDETKYSLTVETSSTSLATSGVSVKLSLFTMVYNEKTGAYTATVTIPATMTVELAGSLSVSESALTFALNTVKITQYNGTEQVAQSVVTLNMTIKVTSEHTLPAVPAIDSNLATMTEEEVEAMGEALVNDEVFAGIIAFFGSLGESATPNPSIE